MTNRDLLKEAIADAKAIKETAIANAKAALEESFTPHLKTILSAKINEMDSYYEEDDVIEAEKDEKKEMDEKKEVEEAKKEVEEAKKEVEEAVKVIKALKNELNEVNLLNAKLLYVNKIFKSKSLTESQKVKVINAFDRAESVKEVKNTYETLKESFNGAASKSTIKESVGLASKPVIGGAATQPIVADDFVARMQKLAGIK